MAEINSQWANEDPTSDEFPPTSMDTGFEEVTEDVANSSLSGSASDPNNHSLPLPEPRKAYGDKYTAEIRKRRCIIWGVASLLIVGVVGAFLGGYLAGEERMSGDMQEVGSQADNQKLEGELSGGSYAYRHLRRMTKKRRHVNVISRRTEVGGEEEFDLAQVFGA
eukprot:CAMPEP_0197449814 /NCGR_PEP_ID=MMETSP1175-20131217/23104_1 /TAXON_ID=1003142 /ORGANISM="Triceratium dubium, Strain CCMP147" /LENGTH=164 /DNA_ID=CAMNT_0042982059 /DNA_START=373 /DNA_END=867 /DNA_ORIENTATION=-